MGDNIHLFLSFNSSDLSKMEAHLILNNDEQERLLLQILEIFKKALEENCPGRRCKKELEDVCF